VFVDELTLVELSLFWLIRSGLWSPWQSACESRIKLLAVFAREICGEWLTGIFNQLTTATGIL